MRVIFKSYLKNLTKNWIRFFGGFAFLVIVTMALVGFISAPLQFNLKYQAVKSQTNQYNSYLVDYSHDLNSNFTSSFFANGLQAQVPTLSPGGFTWKKTTIQPTKYNVDLGHSPEWSFLNQPMMDFNQKLTAKSSQAPQKQLSLMQIIEHNMDVEYQKHPHPINLSDYIASYVKAAFDSFNYLPDGNPTYNVAYEVPQNKKVLNYHYSIPLKNIIAPQWLKAFESSFQNSQSPLSNLFHNEDALNYTTFLNVVVHQWALQHHLNYQYHSNYIIYNQKQVNNETDYFAATGANENNLDNVVLNSGHLPRAPDEAVITPRYAQAHNLHLGDYISPFADDIDTQATKDYGVYGRYQIVGIGVSLDTLTPNAGNFNSYLDDINNYANVYLQNNELIRLEHYFHTIADYRAYIYNTSYLNLQNINQTTFLQQVYSNNGSSLFNNPSNIIVNYKDTRSYQVLTTMLVEVLLFIGIGFVLFFLGFLFLNFLMKQEVNESRYQIGLFKSFGYFHKEIASVLSLKTIVLIFLATWIGYACSIPLQRLSAMLFTKHTLFYVMPIFVNVWFLIVILFVVPLFFCFLSWMWNYWFLLKNNALQLMAPVKNVNISKFLLLKKTGRVKHFQTPFLLRMQWSYTKQGFGKYAIILVLFFVASFLFMVQFNVSSLFHSLFDDVTTVYNGDVANKTTFFNDEDTHFHNTKKPSAQNSTANLHSLALDDGANYYQAYGWWDTANPAIQKEVSAIKQYWHHEIDNFSNLIQQGKATSHWQELQNTFWTLAFLFEPHYLPKVDELPNLYQSSGLTKIPLIVNWKDFAHLLNVLSNEANVLLNDPQVQSFLNLVYDKSTIKSLLVQFITLHNELEQYETKIADPNNLTFSLNRFLFNSQSDMPDYELRGVYQPLDQPATTVPAHVHLLNFQAQNKNAPLAYDFTNNQSYFNMQGVSNNAIQMALEPNKNSSVQSPIPTIISERLALLYHLKVNDVYNIGFNNNLSGSDQQYAFKVVGIQKTNTLENDIYLNYNNFMQKYYDSTFNDKKFAVPHPDPVLQDPLFNNVYSKHPLLDGNVDLNNLPKTFAHLKYNENYVNLYTGNIQYTRETKTPYVTWADAFNLHANSNGVNSGFPFLQNVLPFHNESKFDSFTLQKMLLQQESHDLLLAFTLFQVVVGILLLILLAVIVTVILEESWNFVLIFRAFGYQPRQINLIIVGNYFLSIIAIILVSFGLTIAGFSWLAGYLLHNYNFIILNPVAYPSLLITLAIFSFILISGWIVAWSKIKHTNLLKLKND